jgi:hypothetical protein
VLLLCIHWFGALVCSTELMGCDVPVFEAAQRRRSQLSREYSVIVRFRRSTLNAAICTDRSRCPHRSGAQLKTRKRNIAVPLDPGSFADAVVTIFEDSKEEGNDLEKNLAASVKVLESAELDFSRYGDTLFEVLFAGGRLAGGGNVVEEGKRLDTNVSAVLLNEPALLLVRCPGATGGYWARCLSLTSSVLLQILATSGERDQILPFVKLFQTLIRYAASIQCVTESWRCLCPP